MAKIKDANLSGLLIISVPSIQLYIQQDVFSMAVIADVKIVSRELAFRQLQIPTINNGSISLFRTKACGNSHARDRKPGYL